MADEIGFIVKYIADDGFLRVDRIGGSDWAKRAGTAPHRLRRPGRSPRHHRQHRDPHPRPQGRREGPRGARALRRHRRLERGRGRGDGHPGGTSRRLRRRRRALRQKPHRGPGPRQPHRWVHHFGSDPPLSETGKPPRCDLSRPQRGAGGDRRPRRDDGGLPPEARSLPGPRCHPRDRQSRHQAPAARQGHLARRAFPHPRHRESSGDGAQRAHVPRRAERGIPIQHEAFSRYTGTDTDSIFTVRGGIPCALISLPLRYMHSIVEMATSRTWRTSSAS